MENFGFIRVAAGVPNVKVADVDHNVSEIGKLIRQSIKKNVDILVLPELCITGYTCGDLFEQSLLMKKAERGVGRLIELLDNEDENEMKVIVGCPVMAKGRRFNCAVVIDANGVVGIVPKIHLPNYGEFYEKRWFESGADLESCNFVFHTNTMLGNNLLFKHKDVTFGIEICEDLWVPVPPSSGLTKAGAQLIFNLSASDELIGKHDYLLKLIAQQSARCRCGYIYASAGWGESSTDLVFAGNAIVAEDGTVVETERRFFTQLALVVKDIDVEKLQNDRAKFSTFFDGVDHEKKYVKVRPNALHDILLDSPDPDADEDGIIHYNPDGSVRYEDELKREVRDPELLNVRIDPHPFVPHDEKKLSEHCEEIINIQARGLMQRLNVIGCRNAVIGISGGLDSTLALLVTVRAFDLLGLDRKGIYGITMPGMATTSRTHNNAVGLMEELGVTALEIPIGKAVAQHFEDIGQDPKLFDVTYENSQARERTQILMDYSNKVNGIVIGTGDMSELALGWCTYNGDHMSMYGVNASVPKTLVRHLVKWFATEFGERAKEILLDIVDTPISPELVPSGEDKIGQVTEDLVGPYELHDFFMYHLLRNSFAPRKIFMLARKAFAGVYDEQTLLKWLRNFYRRFFSQQFKRSCMPDGPKVGSVNLSPRGDWRMPSDASSHLWLNEVDSIVINKKDNKKK
ncbi:MAG: NAD(+) synthase [Muribaculaceae bacterium]|nr:NAD(+) synthase [Muribaculaceae bacterium]